MHPLYLVLIELLPIAAMVAGALVPQATVAENLGKRGQTYALDVDGREQFKDVLRRKQASGELDQFWRNYRERTLEAIRHPAPLAVATSYQAATVWNPAHYTLPSSFKDNEGNVIAAKGTEIEPLTRLPLKSGLIFVDGRDPAQVNYAISRVLVEPLKIVLIAGSPIELRQRYRDQVVRGVKGVPFYFDQRAMIIGGLQRLYGLRIASVPALMRQEGTGLRVEFGMPKRARS
jgi:conjugal transfer pilus assembly protein TraW